MWWADLEVPWAQMLEHLARRESECMQASGMESSRAPAHKVSSEQSAGGRSSRQADGVGSVAGASCHVQGEV